MIEQAEWTEWPVSMSLSYGFMVSSDSLSTDALSIFNVVHFISCFEHMVFAFVSVTVTVD